ncbi:MAG TPA: segregation/condensation protein A [Acidimicrobiia bacterium]|jgi:segregation and condensation protein A|nr:segregation/condensation protein A [Acidimicrobiia bacterium]
MTFHVKTTVFEGPLDLLLQLITKHQVEVTAVGLTEVVGEYVAFIDEMKDLDLEVTSEFLLIAATLIQLKAQSLLPTRGAFDLDEELALIEERDRLLSRLLVCVTFKDVAAVLRRRLQEANRFVPRTSGVDQPIASRPADLVVPIDVHGLAVLAVRIFSRQGAEPDLDHLDLDLPSVEEAIEEIRARVTNETMSTFEELTAECTRTVEVAAYFLALLELARWGLIEVSQDDWLSEIVVRDRGQGAVDLNSEWAS